MARYVLFSLPCRDLGITPEYPMHPTVLGLGLGIRVRD